MQNSLKIVIIDYESGNVASVFNAFQQIKKAHKISISHKISEIKAADLLILPGVGSFADCMHGLKKVDGLIYELKEQVLVNKKPLLGVCVGMQVLASFGFENGKHEGLNFIEGEIKKITCNKNLKVPHMGWNDISINSDSVLIKSIKDKTHFYFANSYFFAAKYTANVIAEVDYDIKIPAIIAKDNVFGVQFHPEKSGLHGLQLLKNFLEIVDDRAF